jgi:DNA-binding NarL/FixJ family response regulator
MNRVWVAIAADDEIFRSSFVQYLNGTQEIVVMAEADSGQDAIDLVKLHRPDVLLMV